MKKHQILKVRDKSDNYGTRKGLLFDIPFKLLITAKSGSGGTTLITNLLLNPNFYLKDFKGEDIVIISPSLNNDEKLRVIAEQKDIPEENLMLDYDESVVKALYDLFQEEYEERIEEGLKPKNKLIIMDDLGFSSKMRAKMNSGGQISRMACNGRHISLSLIVKNQTYVQASPTLRANLNGLIVFDTSKKNLDVISEENNFMKKDSEFVKMFRDNVESKSDFIVVNYTNGKKDLYLNKFFEKIDTSKYMG